MACSLKCGSYFSGFNETTLGANSNSVPWCCTTLGCLQSKDSTSKQFPLSSIDFIGRPLVVPDHKDSRSWSSKPGNKFSVQAETICVSRGSIEEMKDVYAALAAPIPLSKSSNMHWKSMELMDAT
ncbi:hypothetical protein PTKIN_Ptkin04bG0067800 [Pterospermum kingtungense]